MGLSKKTELHTDGKYAEVLQSVIAGFTTEACMEKAVSASADTFVFENMSVAISVFHSTDNITCERGLAVTKTKATAPFSYLFIPMSLIFHSSPPFSTPRLNCGQRSNWQRSCR